MTRRVWIVCGKITDEDAAEAYQNHRDCLDAKVGDVEYQFSDGPPGERTFSTDYVDLTRGLRDHAHCKIYWVGSEKRNDLPKLLRERLPHAT